MLTNIKIGSDVEFFVARRADKQIVSAEGFVPGTKDNPFDLGDGFAVQLDNVAIEGNIPPARSKDQFDDNMNELRKRLNQVVEKHGLYIVPVAAAQLSDEELSTENAKRFGCDPSWNCWTLAPEVVEPKDPTIRSAGFHIHIGYDDPEPEINVALARLMDAKIGLPAVLIEEPSKRRTVGYGMSGSFRHQPHGVEYRTLSSSLAANHAPYYIAEIALQTAQLLINLKSRFLQELKVVNAMSAEIQGAINTDDKREAERLISHLYKTNIYTLAVP